MDAICGFESKLLYGIRLEDGADKVWDFELLKAGGVTETIKTNDKFRQNHPQQWMARMLSSVVDNIGGQPVYAEFKKSGFKDIPKPILQLSAADGGFLLAMGHMFTYGPELDLGKQDCPHCGRKALVVLDLTQMRLLNQEQKDSTEFRVDLPTGWYRPAPGDPAKRLTYHGKHWNTYFFRPPTIGDSFTHERHFTRTNTMNFFMRLLWAGLTRVESWEERVPGAGREKVDDLAQNFFNGLGLDLVDDLDSADRMRIRKAMLEIPRLDTDLAQECSACGEDIRFNLGVSEFFPLA